MPLATLPLAPAPSAERSLIPGLVLTGLGLAGAILLRNVVSAIPLIVAAMLVGAAIGNAGLATSEAKPGLGFASKRLLRAGIILLGLRLSVGDVFGLGLSTLAIIVATVAVTFFGVQVVGRQLGLSKGLSLLVASGFSICGTSAIASVEGVANAEEEEVAAAIGLVTLFGAAAVFTLPAVGSLIGMGDEQLGVWLGAGVQDTAQVIAASSAAGPAVLAVATAVKLTRVLLLAPIVAGVSARDRHRDPDGAGARPPLLPRFVAGFLMAIIIRSTGVVPGFAVDLARTADQYLLAAGVVGLGTSVRFAELRQLGSRVVLLGLGAWTLVAGTSLGLVLALA